MNRDLAKTNVIRAGELFVYSIWLQGQMSDLIILNGRRNAIDDFINNPSYVPDWMSRERAKYWEKQFYAVKKEFTEIFTISAQHKDDLDKIYYLRNAIAHSHVSMGRDYFLYRPSGGQQKEKKIISAINLKSVKNQPNPLMLKLIFHDDNKYSQEFSRIKRLDEECFMAIAKKIGVPHSRIR